MSKANSVPKVLRVAIRRVERSWGTGSWAKPTNEKDERGKTLWAVCLEGALFGFCRFPQTDVQREAHALVTQILRDRVGKKNLEIPEWNDRSASQEEVIELLKEALIRAETGGLIEDDEFEISDEEIADILAKDEESCNIKTQDELLGL